MPGRAGVLRLCSNRLSTAAASASLSGRATTDDAAPGEPASATRAGLGLAAGSADAERIGVGIGVLMLRVSVAAAPGTGVASGPSSTEQPGLPPSTRTATSRLARLAKVIAQLLGPTGMSQLAERFGFDLADAFPSNSELTTDFLQRTLASVVQPKTQGDDAALALRQ